MLDSFSGSIEQLAFLDRDDVGVTFQFFGNGDRGFLGLVIAYGYVQ